MVAFARCLCASLWNTMQQVSPPKKNCTHNNANKLSHSTKPDYGAHRWWQKRSPLEQKVCVCGPTLATFPACTSGRVLQLDAKGAEDGRGHPTVCLKLSELKTETTQRNAFNRHWHLRPSDLFGEALESFVCAFQILRRSTQTAPDSRFQ